MNENETKQFRYGDEPSSSSDRMMNTFNSEESFPMSINRSSGSRTSGMPNNAFEYPPMMKPFPERRDFY